MKSSILNNVDIKELESILIQDSKMIPVEYSAIKHFSQEQISLFCHKHAIYQIITTELVEFTKELIGDRKAIEIACGNGCYGRALNIPITDNRMQDWDTIKLYYRTLNTPTIIYQPDTIEYEANVAVDICKPQVIVASWATQLYSPTGGGSVYGINEEDLLSKVETYIHVGNENTHSTKQILNTHPSYRAYKFEWLISRSMDRDNNIIYVFNTKK